ncbi:hypothetical protein NDU88_006518 [Pleurodeles waltl]|uniref:Uncharacterized protein n=1 Tax=Pleurodeles waltl TaxID=8319 RepID=A0AAV7QP64_PLEWA|nr:hypothetical protein NDU88_006518 [Pleurodeles waltl]
MRRYGPVVPQHHCLPNVPLGTRGGEPSVIQRVATFHPTLAAWLCPCAQGLPHLPTTFGESLLPVPSSSHPDERHCLSRPSERWKRTCHWKRGAGAPFRETCPVAKRPHCQDPLSTCL